MANMMTAAPATYAKAISTPGENRQRALVKDTLLDHFAFSFTADRGFIVDDSKVNQYQILSSYYEVENAFDVNNFLAANPSVFDYLYDHAPDFKKFSDSVSLSLCKDQDWSRLIVEIRLTDEPDTKKFEATEAEILTKLFTPFLKVLTGKVSLFVS